MANQSERIEQLEQQLVQLKRQLAQMMGRPAPPSDEPKDRPDFVERGSDRHAAMLGLRRAEEGEQLAIDGWTLEDITQYGPAASDDFLTRVLRQQVNELTSEIPEPQSRDPRSPNFAPVMWDPSRPFSQITEN